MAEALERIFSGNLSRQSGGFLVRLPDGMVGRKLIEDHLEKTYGCAHPDLRVLDPEGRTITVDDIRGLRDFMGTSPMSNGMKTLLVIAAHRMNVQAANAFLKTLEEPSRKTRIVLVTDCPWVLPATVLSRCHKLAVVARTEDIIKEVQAMLGSDASEDNIVSALDLASGNPRCATEILQHKLFEWHEEVLQWLGNPTSVQPKVPGTGKDTPSIETMFRMIQRDVLKTVNGDDGIPGWSSERAEQASIILNKMSRGISRPGLDWKNRLFATLSCLAYMEKAT